MVGFLVVRKFAPVRAPRTLVPSYPRTPVPPCPFHRPPLSGPSQDDHTVPSSSFSPSTTQDTHPSVRICYFSPSTSPLKTGSCSLYRLVRLAVDVKPYQWPIRLKKFVFPILLCGPTNHSLAIPPGRYIQPACVATSPSSRLVFFVSPNSLPILIWLCLEFLTLCPFHLALSLPLGFQRRSLA